MHELSLARGILGIVEAEQKKSGFTRVLEISLKVGEYSGIVPRCLEEFFPIAAGDGAAKDAKLRIEVLPAAPTAALRAAPTGSTPAARAAEANGSAWCRAGNSMLKTW